MDSEHSSRSFLTQLLDSIPSTSGSTSTANPLNSLGLEDRKTLMTLHVLFPDELLPALDLLDRGLVTRLVVKRNGCANLENTEASDTHSRDTVEERRRAIYYVRSSQQRSSNSTSSSSRFHDPTATSYEVRTEAWNCSCPAFAFAAFPSTMGDGNDDVQAEDQAVTAASSIVRTRNGLGSEAEEDTWLFGGLTRGEKIPPLCKHLLASVLVERCQMFSGFVEERVGSLEEAAGWAVGWGG